MIKSNVDLQATYPDLHIYREDNRIVVRGSFPITHEGIVLDRYLIEIELLNDYPASVPIVREIGGVIPRTYDYHIFNERGDACLFIPDERWKVYPAGTSFINFLNGPVRNFFLGQNLVRRGQPWPFGQWGHGAYGKYEYYAELLGINDPAVIRRYVEYLTKKHVKTHWNCPCGSGKQLRACHIQQIQDLRAKIPRSVAKQTSDYLALLEQSRKKSSV